MARSSSYYYWRKREVYNDLTYQKKEAEYTKELNKIYDYAQDQIQKEIDRFYGKYAFEEGITMAEARKRVSQLDIDEYSRKAQKYVKEKDFSKRANEEMRLYNATMKINRLEMLKSKIGLELTAAANEADRYMEDILRSRVNEEYRRQAGILGESIGTNVKDVNSLINASFHNATWSERVWTNQRLLRAELDKLLNTAMIQGKGSRALAQDLHKAMGGAKYNAERLMRTELKRVTSDSQLRSFEEAGFQEYMFMTLSSAPFSPSKVCPICAELNGKTFKIKDAVVGENLPPMHPNCRCSVTAYEGDEGYLDLFRAQNENPNNKTKLAAASNLAYPDTKREYLGSIDPSKVKQAVLYFGDLIKYETVEHSIVIEKSGRVVHFIGVEKGLSMYNVNIEGSTIIHNHPKSEGLDSFGADDFMFLRENNIKELYAINEKYLYRVKVIKSIKELTHTDLKNWATAYLEGNTGDYYIQHLEFTALKDKGYVEYERIELE